MASSPTTSKEARKSWKDDLYRMRKRVLPVLGQKPLHAITRRDVERFCVGVKRETSAASANRHLSLISGCLQRAVEWKELRRDQRGVRHQAAHRNEGSGPVPGGSRGGGPALRPGGGREPGRRALPEAPGVHGHALRRGEAPVLGGRGPGGAAPAPPGHQERQEPDRGPVSDAKAVLENCREFRAEGNPYVFPGQGDGA
jgi:hypothetical protein